MRDPLFPTRSNEQIAADNRDELDAWIDERAAELTARGMPRDEARRRAEHEFGDAEAASRYARRQDAAANRRTRALLSIRDLASDLRIAARTLARTPSVTAIVLLTFALGLGATTAVFSVVHALLLRPLPYVDEQALVQLQALDNGAVGPNARFSAAALTALRENTTSFVGIAAIGTGSFLISENGDPEQLIGISASTDALDVLQAPVAIGRAFAPGDETDANGPVVILGDDLWRRRFNADSTIVGRTIDVSGEPRVVIGIMRPNVRAPTYEEAQLWVPATITSQNSNPNSRHVRVYRLFGRLKPGVSPQTGQADVDRVMSALEAEFPQSYGGARARVAPIRTAVAGDARPRLFVLMGAAAFMLLIACANVAGILLSRALARRHELAVRVALGAGRRRLIRQFLVEGAVLATVGGALGLIVAQLGIVALRHIASTTVPAGTVFALEPRVLLFAISVAVAAALLSSLVPALAGTRLLGDALRRDEGRASLTRANRRLRLGLVASQLAVSVVLLVGAGLLLRALHRLSVLDVGYETEHTLTFRPAFTQDKSDAEQDVFYETLFGELRALPGVASVGSGNVPMSGQSTITGLEVEGRVDASGRRPDVRYSVASDDYFATLGIPVLRGRVFDATDRAGGPWVGVVSVRTTLDPRFRGGDDLPGGNPIGARVKVDPRKPWVTIVGVVGDVRKGSSDPPVPSVYTSLRQDHWPGAAFIIVRATGDPGTLFAGVREVMRRVDPSMPIVGLRTLEDFRRSTPAIADRRLQMQLILVFALIALAVSAIGVYGVSAYATEARSREFGIRIALGAPRRAVLMLALRDAATVSLLGALVGVPLASLLASRLRDTLYTVPPVEPLTIAVVVGTLFVVVLAASIVPARRATLVNPVRAIRAE